MGRPQRKYGTRNVAASQPHNPSFNNLDSKKERARLALEAFTSKPLDDRPIIAPTTARDRNRGMAHWVSYFTNVLEIDPDQIWLDLCRGEEKAINYCRLYLRSYVVDSVQSVAILGPQEFESRRAVNSASSVIQCWRILIASADATVLRHKRRNDPENSHLWRLKFIDQANKRGQGPIFEICQWIFNTLAREEKLVTDLTFDKIEATAEDIIVLLKTLWERADDIPCHPSSRLSFHGTVLLAAIGGFRRGTIATLRYKDVCMAVVRDPTDRSKTKLVVTVTIGKNKLKRASRVSRATSISFSMTLVPYSPVCLASIIATRAIKDNAFKAGFDSVGALLSRPALESVDFLPLDWKEEMLDQSVFDLSDGTFYNLWYRGWVVAGMRLPPRFYATRVGAGGRLDGVLTDALRNYILSNTTQVFQGSYQPQRVREDLTTLAFGPMAGQNDNLFHNLRSMSLSRDTGAPVDIMAKDLKEFENRSDMRDLRAKMKEAQQTGSKKAVRSIRSQINNRILTLSELKLDEMRAAYFERVDCLRAQGLSTSVSSGKTDFDGALPKARSSDALLAVARFISSCTQKLDEGCSVEQRAKQYMELLVDYLAYRPKSGLPPGPTNSKTEVGSDAAEPPNEPPSFERTHAKQSRCLLCEKPFCSRSDLTKHCQRVHVKNGTFNWPFPCPECCRLGKGDILIEGGPSAWSNHAETTHGKIYAPNLPSIAPPIKGSLQCLLCKFAFQEGGGLWRHTRQTHDQKEGLFEQSLTCPECSRQGKSDTYIGSFNDWKYHVLSVHTELEGQQPPPSRCNSNELCSDDGGSQGTNTGKRKRDEGGILPDFIVSADPESAIHGGWCELPITTSNTTCTASETTADLFSESQTPASSVDSEMIQKIDPRLLSTHSRQDHMRVENSLLDDPKVTDHDQHLSIWTAQSGHVLDGGLEDTAPGIFELGRGSSIDPPLQGLSHTRAGPLSDAEPIKPMTLSATSPIDHRPTITLELVQETTNTGGELQPKKTRVSELTSLAQGDDNQHVSSSKSMLPDPRNDEDTRLVHPQAEMDGSPTSQQLVQATMEAETGPTSATTPDPEDLISDIAKLWGRGYTLAPEGSELSRHTNNAQRRKEISSNISSEHVITGKRQRPTKNLKQKKRTRR